VPGAGLVPRHQRGAPAAHQGGHIGALRAALEHHGVETDTWWERQVAVCLLGTVVQFGWEKAFGDDDELGWWCDRAREGARYL